MKKGLNLIAIVFGLFFLTSCSKTESDFSGTTIPETITISSNTLNASTGSLVTFIVTSSVNNNNITAQSTIYVNGSVITGNTYSFTQAGRYAIYASKGSLNSSLITIEVTAVSNSSAFKHKTLVEEFSGTWCGNCPRILYGVDLLHQQTDKAIVVGIHLFGSDPFISSDGNSLAAALGVNAVPTGNINRSSSWVGPQYENVPQVINSIQASSTTGLAINSVVAGNNLSVNIKVGYSQGLSSTAKLTVYLLEDKLLHTQQNYSSNLYGGQASISNFEYNGVLRKVISAITGDAIPSSGTANEKNYTVNIPANVSNIANTKIVAFVTDASGKTLNVQAAKTGENKIFETL